MPLFKQIQDKGLVVSVWKMEETEEQLYDLLGRSSNKLKTECDKRFTAGTRKKEWLSVRVLVRQLLGENVSIGYRKNGEPFLIGSEKKISISHTREFVAVAIHPHYFVGVDIETFSHRIDHITDKIMSSSERGFLESSADSETWYSLLVWSMKESIFKCLDLDYLDYKKGILVTPFKLLQSGETSIRYVYNNFSYIFPIHYLCTEKFVLTWCSERPYNI